MATHRRRGHWRRGRGGQRHWVSEHTVQRGSPHRQATWSSFRQPTVENLPNSGVTRLNVAEPVTAIVHSARFVRPNARCPVCGQQVFFYSNQHGSRVFFDELGPPWPKHPCTDVNNVALQRVARSAVGPTLRPLPEVRQIARNSKFATPLANAETYLWKYGQLPGSAWVVLDEEQVGELGTRLHLQRADRILSHIHILVRRDVRLGTGTLVFLSDRMFSCFDWSSMTAAYVPFEIIDAPGWLERLRRLFVN